MHARDRQLQRNILGGAGFQIAGVLLSLLALPLMLNMLGQSTLGVWLTLLSIFQWLTFFDLGIASGVRNAVAGSMATQQPAQARTLIATGYWYSLLITLAIAALFLAGYWLLTPAQLFHDTRIDASELDHTVLVSLALVSINLVLGLVHQLYAALERPAAIPLSGMLANLLFVTLLLGALQAGTHSLVVLAMLYGGSLALTRLALTLRFFRLHPELRPATADIDHALRGELFSFGLKIFVIQVCAMILFTTDKVLIAWLLQPADVVNYESAMRLFGLVTMFHTLVMNSYWSSFTHAAHNGEWNWIARTLRRLLLLMLPVMALAVVITLLAQPLIRLWMNDGATSAPSLYWACAAYTVLSCWSNIFAYFVNGIGRVNLQLVSAIIAAAINIPLSIMFVRSFDLGITGIVLATVVSLCMFSVLGPLQTRRILASAAR